MDLSQNRKVLPITILIDLSGSMKARKIQELNGAMSEVFDKIKSNFSGGIDADVSLRVLGFGNGKADYIMGARESGVDLLDDECNWIEVSDDECFGDTPLGKCLKEVNWLLFGDNNAQCLCAPNERLASPVFILITDGCATDDRVTVHELEKFKSSDVVRQSKCIAVGIGFEEDPSIAMDERRFARESLEEFSSSPEDYVYFSSDNDNLRKLLSEIVGHTIQANMKNEEDLDDIL